MAGKVYLARDHSCDDAADEMYSRRDKLYEAYWDPLTLAMLASTASPSDFDYIESARYWMGPDYGTELFANRMHDNLNRVYKMESSSNKEYVTVTCADPANKCKTNVGGGKAVGGFTESKQNWFGYWYHYITFCPAFFTADSLTMREHDAMNDDSHARQMAWLRNNGQYFLHELMHTRMAYYPEPKIIDVRIGYGQIPAYGPYNVRNLAKESREGNQGTEAASRNADSYAMFANSLWFKKKTRIFPNAPQDVTAVGQRDLLVFPRVEIDGQDGYSTTNADAMLSTEFDKALQNSKDEVVREGMDLSILNQGRKPAK